jgi:hypothetical protein
MLSSNLRNKIISERIKKLVQVEKDIRKMIY